VWIHQFLTSGIVALSTMTTFLFPPWGSDAVVAAPMPASGSNWIPHAEQRHLLPPPPPLTSYQTPTRRRPTGSKNIQQSSQFLSKHSSTSGAYQVLSIGYFADEENDHVIDDDGDEDNMMLTTIVNDEKTRHYCIYRVTR
jgi:hypothetical protein